MKSLRYRERERERESSLAPTFLHRKFAHRSSNGFTIVELLIVIVVIGILAAITIVAYSGISQKATNATRVAAARNALMLIQSYAVIKGYYPVLPDNPTSPGTREACIGTGYPTLQGSPVCWNIFTDGGVWGASTFPELVSVNQELATVGSVPNYPQQNVYEGTYGAGAGLRPLVMRGLALVERPVAANASYQLGYSLAYLLSGAPPDTDCGVSGAVKSPQSGDTRYQNLTACIIPLPALSP